jgi:hypothetical protein
MDPLPPASHPPAPGSQAASHLPVALALEALETRAAKPRKSA